MLQEREAEQQDSGEARRAELQGEEYAAYRALTDTADKADLRSFLNAMEQEKNKTLQEYYWLMFRLILEKNSYFFEVLKEDREMSAEDMLMELLKDRVDQKIEDAVTQERNRAEEAIRAEKAARAEKVKAEKAARAEKAKAEADIKAVKAQAQENTVNYIRNLMDSMNLSVQKAMDSIKIPASERSMYEGLVMREN